MPNKRRRSLSIPSRDTLRLKLRVGRGYEERGELQESNFWQEHMCSVLGTIKLVSSARRWLNKLFTLIRHTGGRQYPDGFEIPGFRVALAAPACPE